ncbi:hypothetical protein PIB30_080535 [Stylosanthes scabra]|uniref:Uncharacterized protein n=1 Tax=Stylosanthes scabra TaxID=79078 RepID=A0ABU6RRQ6_9FABA|nr:hypothetical protein [Stylosanthes scabra]
MEKKERLGCELVKGLIEWGRRYGWLQWWLEEGALEAEKRGGPQPKGIWVSDPGHLHLLAPTSLAASTVIMETQGMASSRGTQASYLSNHPPQAPPCIFFVCSLEDCDNGFFL